MRYHAEALKNFSIQVMSRCGLSREESEIFSDSLIRADLRGISSHGLTRLTAYARRVTPGGWSWAWWPGMSPRRSPGTGAA